MANTDVLDKPTPSLAHGAGSVAPTGGAPAQAPIQSSGPPSGTPGVDSFDDGVSRTWVIRTSVACLAFALFGHVMLWIFYRAALTHPDQAQPWQPSVGISLTGVAVVAMGGFYLATRRARVAIAVSFLLTFLVLLSYELTLDGLASATSTDGNGASDLLKDFRSSIGLILGFYFGTDGAIAVAKVIGASRAGTVGQFRALVTADRDLAAQRTADAPVS